MIGSVIGNYRITGRIESGGMGEVFKGLDLMLEREVAIKALRPELARQPEVVERFRGEAITLARLNHPHVATLYSFLRHGDDYFMVMEYVRGLTLAEIIRRQGALPLGVAVSLMLQALDGLDEAHRLGIVHRDLKPANLMVNRAGALKLMDFGIARMLGAARLTRDGRLIGTLEYMSPEQIRGQETDARSDLYSLGALGYEMLAGRMPFQAHSDYELMRSQVELAPPSPREFAPHLPATVAEVILRALAKAPADRFQSAAEFRRALLSCVGAEETTSPAALLDWIQFAEPQPAPASSSDAQVQETRLPSERWPTPAAAELAAGVSAGAKAALHRAVAALRNMVEAGARRRPELSRRLDWRHYVGAASAAMLVVGVTLGVIGLSQSGKPQMSSAAVTPAVSPAVSTPSVAPAAESAPSGASGKALAADGAPNQTPPWPGRSSEKTAEAASRAADRSGRQSGGGLTPGEKERRRRSLLRELEGRN